MPPHKDQNLKTPFFLIWVGISFALLFSSPPPFLSYYSSVQDVIEDTLLNEYGKVFDGSLSEHRTIHWFYGHFARVRARLHEFGSVSLG